MLGHLNQKNSKNEVQDSEEATITLAVPQLNTSFLTPYNSWKKHNNNKRVSDSSSKDFPPSLSSQCSPATDDSAFHDCNEAGSRRLTASSIASTLGLSPYLEGGDVMTDSAVSLKGPDPPDNTNHLLSVLYSKSPSVTCSETFTSVSTSKHLSSLSPSSRNYHQNISAPVSHKPPRKSQSTAQRPNLMQLPVIPQSGLSDISLQSSDEAYRINLTPKTTPKQRPSSLAVTPKSTSSSEHLVPKFIVGSSDNETSSSSVPGSAHTNTPSCEPRVPSRSGSSIGSEELQTPVVKSRHKPEPPESPHTSFEHPFIPKQYKLKSKKHNIDRFPYIDDSFTSKHPLGSPPHPDEPQTISSNPPENLSSFPLLSALDPNTQKTKKKTNDGNKRFLKPKSSRYS